MSNLKTELKELWKITKFFGQVFALIGFGWFVIVGSWAVFGN